MLMVIIPVRKGPHRPTGPIHKEEEWLICVIILTALISYINYIAWNGMTIVNIKLKRNAEGRGRSLF
jgi:hypothetical protein